jgi:ketosteroid isomerase-like protein
VPRRPLPPIAVTLGFVDRINRGDLDALVDLMTEDHTLVVMNEAPLAGRAANRDAWEGYFRSYPEYVIHPRHLATRGTTVAVLGTTTGSHLGLPDDEERRLDVVWIAEVIGAHVSRWQVASDDPDLRARFGIPPDV